MSVSRTLDVLASVAGAPDAPQHAETVTAAVLPSRMPMSVDLQALPAEIRDRVPVAFARAAAKTAQAATSSTAGQLLRAAQGARSVRQRVIWLHRWASAWVEPLTKVGACRRGCAHCCHLPLAITSAEAHHIARHTGRQVVKPATAVPVARLDEHDAQDQAAALALTTGAAPCPFLVGSECSIYPWRPLSCRLHVSLDDDDLLCRLIDGQMVPVPYVDTRRAWLVALAAQVNEQLADIRAYFPADGSAERARPGDPGPNGSQPPS